MLAAEFGKFQRPSIGLLALVLIVGAISVANADIAYDPVISTNGDWSGKCGIRLEVAADSPDFAIYVYAEELTELSARSPTFLDFSVAPRRQAKCIVVAADKRKQIAKSLLHESGYDKIHDLKRSAEIGVYYAELPKAPSGSDWDYTSKPFGFSIEGVDPAEGIVLVPLDKVSQWSRLRRNPRTLIAGGVMATAIVAGGLYFFTRRRLIANRDNSI